MKSDIRTRYEIDGYYAPITVLNEAEAASMRAHLDAHEAAHGPLSPAHRNNPHLLFTWLNDLIRKDTILDAVGALIGDDILVWGTTLFIKEPRHPGFVSWHQDSTYWGLDPADVVTAWVALSESNSQNGALCVVPGSHALDQRPHIDTFDSANMLSRGQEIAVKVDPATAMTLTLDPGQMSLHHVRMIHGSGSNVSDRRRIGFAIRYLPPHVRQLSGNRDTATLVRGRDRHGNFDMEQVPRRDFGAEEQQFHEHVAKLQNQIIMAGATVDPRRKATETATKS
ncbi:syringomycin biosynthesis enzyme [Steroidobacter agaridevorans]|uniref:Syringomycin biosynthesis enzyme n=1 Tax=Steroidobacter agaridevorans TaxID=2695856 RepID=A0A829Y859_9GAMM|nr:MULTISPECIES: phytanoyl-CoA dioxygenase family protein [Steroidobacteraceae]GFE79223.1 syringomycin biosynthesis enzyme [Steroidobacter agaridevorans]GFE87264.1 syringomycin biosynthesis enzyme [Steroidobacter agaridevorans]